MVNYKAASEAIVKNNMIDPIPLAAHLKPKHEGSYLLSIISGDGDSSHVTYFDI
jgi:hypothetical protein